MATLMRQAARLVVIDRAKSVLLVRYDDRRTPGASFWATPGGGVEAGESARDAAQRELNEETGLLVSVGPELWRARAEFRNLNGQVSQDEFFYLVEVAEIAPPVHNRSDEPISQHRWWKLSELRDSKEVVYPEDLVDRLEALAGGGA